MDVDAMHFRERLVTARARRSAITDF